MNEEAVKAVNGEASDYFDDFFGDDFFDDTAAEEAAPEAKEENDEAAPSIEEEQNPDQEIENVEIHEAQTEDKPEISEAPANDAEVEDVDKKKNRKTRRRTRTSKSSLEAEPVRNPEEPDSIDPFFIPINPELNTESMIAELGLLPSVDFEDKIADIEEKMNAIKVERNLDAANIMLLNDRIDELADILYADFAEIKSFYDDLTNKDDGIIAITKKMNMRGEGTVADKERRALEVCMNYKTPAMTRATNLIQMAWAVRYQYNFLETAINQLENKRRLVKSQSDAMSMLR